MSMIRTLMRSLAVPAALGGVAVGSAQAQMAPPPLNATARTEPAPWLDPNRNLLLNPYVVAGAAGRPVANDAAFYLWMTSPAQRGRSSLPVSSTPSVRRSNAGITPAARFNSTSTARYFGRRPQYVHRSGSRFGSVRR